MKASEYHYRPKSEYFGLLVPTWNMTPPKMTQIGNFPFNKIELSELIEFERERDHDCSQNFIISLDPLPHAWITDSAPESIERWHDRSRNRFSGTPLKKCARIGRPGGRQVAGGQAGGQKPCAPVTADGPTQSEAVRGSTPPYSAVRVNASLWGVCLIITHSRLHFFGDSNSSI
eukprot:COSAG01_NODE_140_length_24259_cov_41.225096_17_plen_174_part_00